MPCPHIFIKIFLSYPAWNFVEGWKGLWSNWIHQVWSIFEILKLSSNLGFSHKRSFKFQISLKFHTNAIMPGFQPKEKHFVRFISLLVTILEYILPVFWLLRHSWLNNKENADSHMWSQLLRFKPGCFDLTVLARFLWNVKQTYMGCAIFKNPYLYLELLDIKYACFEGVRRALEGSSIRQAYANPLDPRP